MSRHPLLERVTRSMAACALAVVLGAAGQDVTVTGPQPAVPGHIVATGTLTYNTVVDGQGCSLRYWPSEASAILGTTLSPATLEQFGACIGPLLDAVLRDHPAVPELTLTLGDLTALTARINEALSASSKWNSATGVPRTGSLSGLVTGLINEQYLVKALSGAFQRRGYDLRATSVRMVSTGPVASFGGRRLLTGISLLEFKAKHVSGGQ